MKLWQSIALTMLSSFLKRVVIQKSKELNTLNGVPYILKTPIRTKVRLLKEQMARRAYRKPNILSLEDMQSYQRNRGDAMYLQGDYLKDSDYLEKKLKYLATQEEKDYTLHIPSITQRILDDPKAYPVPCRPKPERVDVTLNELLLYLAQRVNKDNREAAIAVVNSMFDVPIHQETALPTDFQFSALDVQLYEQLVAAGAQRHKAGTKALTRAFQNIHSMLSKTADNLYAKIDFENDELNELKHKKFTIEEIVFYFKSYIKRAKKFNLKVDRSISRFFFYGFTDKPWSPLMSTYLSYTKYMEKKKNRKKKTFKKFNKTGKTGNTFNQDTYKPKRAAKDFEKERTYQETQVSDTVRRRRKVTGAALDPVAAMLKRELEKIPLFKSEGMDDASYIRLSERLRTASSNYKPNPTYQHIHHGALENVFVNYVKDRSNSVGFKVAFIFSPTFLERFVGQAFRDKYIVLANSGIGYKGQFDYKPQQPRV